MKKAYMQMWIITFAKKKHVDNFRVLQQEKCGKCLTEEEVYNIISECEND